METLNTQIKNNLCKLLLSLKTNQEAELGKFTENTKNGSFIIEFSGDTKGIHSTVKFLDALKAGNLVRSDSLPKISEEIHTKTTIYHNKDNDDLNVVIGKDGSKIIFTPNGEYASIINGLQNAIRSTQIRTHTTNIAR